MSRQSIAVIGDFMLDEYIWGEVSRISPEAPVPVVQVQNRSFRLGGAANVANNLSSLGVKTHCFGVVGSDIFGRKLKFSMKKRKINISGIIEVKNRLTTLKTRVIAGHQQVVRIDHETVKEISRIVLDKIFKRLELLKTKVSSIIISDYNKGVISGSLMQALVEMAKRHGIFVAVDPKKLNFDIYKGVSLVTPNFQEAKQAVHSDFSHKAVFEKNVTNLIKINKIGSVLVTHGSKGMVLFQKKQKPIYMDTVAREVFDVTGAGDTVISSYVAAISSGASALEAMLIATHAAGVVIREIGTASVTPQQLMAEMFGN